MESVGNYLKNLRLSKSISIEEVVRNTNIPRKYIENIEKEDFSDFPGEVYIKGYIKSYASFLGGDPEYALKLYEKKKIEEKDVPFEMLIGRKESIFDRINFRKILPAISIILIVLGIVAIVVSLILTRSYEVIVDNENVKTIIKPFSIGEEFYYKLNNKDIVIKLIEVRNNGNDIILSINNTISSFLLKNKSMMDFNMDGIVDLEIKYEAFIDGKPRIKMSFYKTQEKKSKEETVFLEKAIVPLDFEISAQDLVWISTSADNYEEEQELLNKGNSKKISVKNKLILKTSSIESVTVKVNGTPVEIKEKGPSYISFEVIETTKGINLKISYME